MYIPLIGLRIGLAGGPLGSKTTSSSGSLSGISGNPNSLSLSLGSWIEEAPSGGGPVVGSRSEASVDVLKYDVSLVIDSSDWSVSSPELTKAFKTSTIEKIYVRIYQT